MPAPGQVVHLQQGSVGHLHQEDAIARDGADGAEVGFPRENVEAVEHKTDSWVVGAADGFPGIAVVIDVPAPRKRLEGDAQAALGWPVPPSSLQVCSRTIDAAEAVGGDIAADHEQVAAKFFHDVELAFGAGEHALLVARLACPRNRGTAAGSRCRARAGPCGWRTSRGCTVEGDEVVLENLDCIELCGSDGIELLAQRCRSETPSRSRSSCDHSSLTERLLFRQKFFSLGGRRARKLRRIARDIRR